MNKVVQIVTNDGRNIVGILKGFDQTTNVILEDCNERVFSSDSGVEQVMKMYILQLFSILTLRTLPSGRWHWVCILYVAITCASPHILPTSSLGGYARLNEVLTLRAERLSVRLTRRSMRS